MSTLGLYGASEINSRGANCYRSADLGVGDFRPVKWGNATFPINLDPPDDPLCSGKRRGKYVKLE